MSTRTPSVRAKAALVLISAALALGPAAVARADSGPLLDPTNNDAMLNLLMENGVVYDTAEDATEAYAYSGGDTTLVINDDETSLSASDISLLADTGWGRVIILTTDPDVLAAFAPGVSAADSANVADGAASDLSPACAQPDAAAAGALRSPGYATAYTITDALDAGSGAGATGASATATPTAPSFVSGVTGCYDVDTGGSTYEPTMVALRNSQTGGDVVLLGSSAFTQNQYLADDGDAALALRLFGAHSTLVWLAASFTNDPNLGDCGGAACNGANPTAGSGGGGDGNQNPMPTPPPNASGASTQQVNSLLPHWIWWAVLQLAVAAAALAYWRARRMGRLVGEALPVRVRAAETVEGHANLYRRAAAHGRAAHLLRQAAARRIAPLLGLPAGPAGRSPQMLVAPLAARLGYSPEQMHAVLVGDVPQTEAELVRLTDQLDLLEQEVRSP